jgi:hypothetical protein
MIHAAPGRRLLILGLAAAAAALAQPTQLSGLLQDSSGGVMDGVSVTLQNQDTGIRRLTRTNSEGIYVIPSLQPGPYRITVRKEGFRSLARSGFRLELGQHARIDFSLQVGSVEEIITVESPPPWFSGETGAVGTLVPRAFADHLPVNGRSLLTLLELSPGLVITPVFNSLEAGQFSVNGLRPNANLITIDGASGNFGIQDDSPGSAIGGNLPALSSIGSLHGLVSLAAVEEFRLDAVAGAAEHGRFAGVHVTLGPALLSQRETRCQ